MSLPKSASSPPQVQLRLENEAFYCRPPSFEFDHPLSPSSPLQSPTSRQTAMLDIKESPATPTNPTAAAALAPAPAAAAVVVAAAAPASAQEPAAQAAAATPATSTTTTPLAGSALPPIDPEGDIIMDAAPNGDSQEQALGPLKVIPEQQAGEPTSTQAEGVLGPNGVATVDEKTKEYVHKIEELGTLVTQLQINLNDTLQYKQNAEDELRRTRNAYDELARQHNEVQQKLFKREKEYDLMSKNYLDHVRLIRPTDDDHSTIMDRLTQLKASIEHLIRKAQGGRSVNLNKAAAIEHFKESGLLEKFPVAEDKLEAYHLNLYMESVIMSTLVSCFFDKPLSCVFEYNDGFKKIYEWMMVRNDKHAVRWRQQLCVMLTQDPATKELQQAEVQSAADALTELISRVYTNSSEAAKIRDICSKAIELAVAMTGQEAVISPVTVPLGTPFDEENMATSLKSNIEGKVALVIFPSFKDTANGFDVRPKVWCY